MILSDDCNEGDAASSVFASAFVDAGTSISVGTGGGELVAASASVGAGIDAGSRGGEFRVHAGEDGVDGSNEVMAKDEDIFKE